MKELDRKIFFKFKHLIENEKPKRIFTGCQIELYYGPEERYDSDYIIRYTYESLEVANKKNVLNVEPEDYTDKFYTDSSYNKPMMKKVIKLRTPSGGDYIVKFLSEQEFDSYCDIIESIIEEQLFAELD